MSDPEKSRSRTRHWVVGVLATVALAAGAGVGGYQLGASEGPDLDQARAAAAESGRATGSAIGEQSGRRAGRRAGREAGYRSTFRRARRSAYQQVLDEGQDQLSAVGAEP